MTTNLIGPGKSVPFISQIDDVVEGQWKGRFCGIVAVYMVLSYYWRTENDADHPDLKTVSSYGLDIGGYTDGVGWVHSKLADVARHYGFSAVARSWFVRERDTDNMQNLGRLSSEEEKGLYRQQVCKEFLATVRSELSSGVPVILSVKEKFGNNGGNHLVVVTGMSDDGAAVTVNDPETSHNEAQQSIPVERLLKYSNFNAIFIYGKDYVHN